MNDRVYLCPPHIGDNELSYVREAFDTNWIAPLGPQIELFEKAFAKYLGVKHAVAVTSGTAALHLALRSAGIGPGDEVLCSTFTFIASASPIIYLGASPVFIDSEPKTWNLDPELLEKFLTKRASKNKLPKAVVVVHLYGQSADMDTILEVCNQYDVTVIEDAAEALGALYKGRHVGTMGHSAIFSFNGNKIITTSGGGMVVTDEAEIAEKIRFWATQAKEPSMHYEHKEIGYNYRLSNVAAAIGRGQMEVLQERITKKREIFENYNSQLSHLPGITFMPEPDELYSTRWLTCMTVESEEFGTDIHNVIGKLGKNNIESRPLWKPMHMQPVFKGYPVIGGHISEVQLTKLFHIYIKLSVIVVRT